MLIHNILLENIVNRNNVGVSLDHHFLKIYWWHLWLYWVKTAILRLKLFAEYDIGVMSMHSQVSLFVANSLVPMCKICNHHDAIRQSAHIMIALCNAILTLLLNNAWRAWTDDWTIHLHLAVGTCQGSPLQWQFGCLLLMTTFAHAILGL